jgi:lipid II:glycine glycyltransferase (peptidoglycan interpeptide bridge formation enzyme)
VGLSTEATFITPVHNLIGTTVIEAGQSYRIEVDRIDSLRWAEMLNGFADASIYQTWQYGLARSGPAHISRLVVKRGSDVVAMAQARLALIPILNFGMTYIFWGPLWRRRDGQSDPEVLRHAIRALRAEYVVRRKMVVRLVPNLPDNDNEPLQQILEEEGYLIQPRAKRRRTILMDIRPSMEQLYKGLHQKWRNHLNKARKQHLELVEGEGDALFEAFERIHAEMVDRKQFVDFTDPGQFRTVQRELRQDQKMRVFLCKSEGRFSAGAICSALGETAIYLLGATNSRGMQDNGSYLVHWRMLEWVKSRGCQFYDLNGINPNGNPGVYEFKSRLAGKHGSDVHLLGAFDAYPSPITRSLVTTAEVLRLNLKKAVAYLSRCGWRDH